jgi:VWFA-related protein
MKKFFLTFALLFCFAFVVAAQTPAPTATPAAAEEEDVVKISTTLIQIDVTVTDKNGKVVTDLKPEEVEVYENGVKQNITNFSFVSNVKTTEEKPAATAKPDKNALPTPPTAAIRPEQVQRTIALVADDLNMSFESVYYARRALKKFVDEQMQPGDLVAIIRTGSGVGALQQFTSDKRQLYAAIERIRWNPAGTGNVGAFAPIQSSGATGESSSSSSGDDDGTDADEGGGSGSTETGFNNFRESVFAVGTLGALRFIIGGMQQLPGRKSVMLLSDGFKLFETEAGGATASSRVLDYLKRLVDLANRSSVVVYTLDPRGLQTTGIKAEDDVSGLSGDQIEEQLSSRRAQLFDTQEGLTYLARETGGFPIINNNDLSGGIRRILDDQSYYLVGYQPDESTFDAKNARFNRLQIKVNRKDVRVRYRSGFFGVSDEQAKKPEQNLTPQQQITNALTSPFATGSIALRLNALFGNDAKDGSFVRSLLHVNAKDLKFTDAANGVKKAVFDVVAVSYGDNGLVADQISRTYTLEVKPDRYKKILEEGFVYFFTFPVKKPGAYQLRVAVRDEQQAASLGSANQFIEVPNLKRQRLTVSGIVLENLTAEQWQKFQGATLQSAASSGAAVDATNPLFFAALPARHDSSLRRGNI